VIFEGKNATIELIKLGNARGVGLGFSMLPHKLFSYFTIVTHSLRKAVL
jgi:hypothetical protein